MGKIKVCFFLNGLQSIGGIGRVTSIIANKLALNENYEVFVLSYSNKNRENVYLLNPNVKFEYLFESHMSVTKSFFHGIIKKLRNYLNNNNIKYLVSCGDLFIVPAILASKKINVKCVFWDHTSPFSFSDHKFQKFCKKYGAKKSTYNFLLTTDSKEYYDKICDSNKNFVMYNPIDEKIKTSITYNDASKKIISVGRFTYQKNFECLVDVAEMVLKSNDWTWDIYGDGEDFSKINDLIKEKKLENKLILKGFSSNIYELYKNYSFIVMTSRYEGFPMTLLEAASNGLPIVCFDVKTGPKEIVSEKNGFLVEFENNDDMVKKILKLIESNELRKNLSVGSLNVCERFKLSNIVLKWEDILK